MNQSFDIYADDSLTLKQILQILENKHHLEMNDVTYAFSCLQNQTVCIHHSLKQLHIHSGDLILFTAYDE